MSRLDSAIRRLEAQRDCLDRAAGMVTDVPGPVFELGLGNGRTYDHLRASMPDRIIFVFDRHIAAHPDRIPPDDCLFLGDFRETLPAAVDRFRGSVALIHADIGTGDADASRGLARALLPALVLLLAKGGVLVSDQPQVDERLHAEPLPPGVPAGRYFLYRSD